VVVWGLLAHSPFGGMTWQVLHYVVGLRQLGFDVWYVEDSDQRMLDLSMLDWATSAERNAAYADGYLRWVGLGDRWVIREPGSHTCYGSRDWDGVLRLYRDADLVINLCGSHRLYDYHDRIRHLLYMETDPVVNQVALAEGNATAAQELARYHTLATYATNLGASDCLVPPTAREWITTLPPVVVPMWQTELPPQSRHFTTVMNWSSPERSVQWRGHDWAWSKRSALKELVELPARSSVPLEIALRGAGPDVWEQLATAGWRIAQAQELDRPGHYRRYIRGSSGEVSVAKDLYVLPRTGWTSDRTVCYLAAGRPAVVQRTGIQGVPLGEGLLDFASLDDATTAIDSVVSDYERHAQAAGQLAAEYFGADRVLQDLLARAGLW
jgi:hypothetical protein